MRKKTRSILEELQNYRHTGSEHMIEASASNILESVINLLDRVNNQYGSDASLKLEKKFTNALKTGDTEKFRRGMRKIIEESKNDPTL